MSIERKLIGTTDVVGEPLYVEDVFNTWLYTGNGGSQTINNGIDLATKGGMVWTQTRSGTNADSGYNFIHDTARGANNWLNTTTIEAQGGNVNMITAFNSNGYNLGNFPFTNGGSTNYVSWTFRKAPKFFDVVTYTGIAAAQNINHSLGVVPELIIVKSRNASFNWVVYNKTIGNSYFLQLQGTNASQYGSYWSFTSPTTSTFPVNQNAFVNDAGYLYVAYLFASYPGVSKVGSYTGNGSSQTIDCGFTAGARFVLIKRTDSAGDWYVWDTARGIVSGNDPRLSLNSSSTEVTTDDSIDPTSSGFIVNQLSATNINVSSATYIYLTIA